MTTVIFHSYVSLPEGMPGMPRTAWFYTPPGLAWWTSTDFLRSTIEQSQTYKIPLTPPIDEAYEWTPNPPAGASGVGKNGIPFYPGNLDENAGDFLSLKVSIPFEESWPMLTMNWDFVPLCNVTGKHLVSPLLARLLRMSWKRGRNGLF